MATIKNVIDSERGCGWRKPGGLYFMSSGLMKECFLLPIELSVCPCCGTGIKHSKGFRWVHTSLFKDAECRSSECKMKCPPFCLNENVGLIWIGKQFYKTTAEFTRESIKQGISRRINSIPRGFKIGETWIVIAHINAFKGINEKGDPEMRPGIFSAFKPDRIEYVVKEGDPMEYLDKLERRGITCVRITRKSEYEEIFNEEIQ